MKKLMLSGILALVLLPLAGQTIDLSASSWYFRSGFSRVWIDAVPAITDSAWKVIQAPGGKTTMAIRDLGISGVPAVFRWNPLPAPAVSVCVLIPFTVSESFLEVTDPALLLAQVGQSWSIYLNGSHMYSEMNRDSSDSYIDKSERKALIPLDAAMLKKGLNILAIHVMGDPGNERMGFNLKSPYVIDSYQVLAKNKQEYVDIVLISIYAIFALYNIVLFLLRPKEKSYLFFGLATLMLSTYLGSRTFFLTALVNDTMASNSLEVVALFCILPLFLAFFDLVLKRKIALVTMLFSGFYLLLIVPALILRSEPFMALWLLSAPVFILYFLVFVLGRTIVAETGVMLQAIRDTGFRGLIRAFRRFNAENDAGKIMVGTLIFIAAAIFDMIRVLNGQDLFLVKYSFVFFIMGVATMQAGKVLTIYASLEDLNAGLEHTVIERTSALAGATAERKRLNAKILESNRELQSAIEESGRDMSMAVSVQKGFFPAVAPKVAGWDIALIFEPAAGVSGDLYDFYTNGDELNGVLVGDVSGMGIASGLITLLARSIFFRKLKDAEIIGLPDDRHLVAVDGQPRGVR